MGFKQKMKPIITLPHCSLLLLVMLVRNRRLLSTAVHRAPHTTTRIGSSVALYNNTIVTFASIFISVMGSVRGATGPGD